MQHGSLKFLFIGVLLLSVGCEQPEQIQEYRIPKSHSDLGDIGTKQLPVSSASTRSVESRMVVAIAERSDATWFFKVTGPTDAVGASEDDWQSILRSVNFGDDGKPAWQLPEGWKTGPTKPMRFATLLTTVENGDVEMSISNLGPNQDLLENVNRWRKQLGLTPLAEDDLELTTQSGESGELKIFDAIGTLELSSSMASEQLMAPPENDLKYDIPDGWVAGRASMMVPVRLRFGSDSSAPQITVTQLLSAANQWLPNAQRWAGQVGVPQDESTLAGLSDKVTIDAIEGQKIVLIPEDDESKFAMIGAMVVRDDIAWFFKLIGEKKFVEENQLMFDEFLESFQFDQD